MVSALEATVLTREDYIENILDHHDHPRNKRWIKSADI